MTLSRSADHSPDVVSTRGGWVEVECEKCGEHQSLSAAELRSDGMRGPCSGLKRSELDRGSGPAPVSDRRSEKRPDLGTDLEEYVEGLDCLLYDNPEHRCRGDVVAHHIRHKAHAGDWTTRGGQKVGNLVPLCSVNGHQGGPESVHEMGRSSFEERWGLSLAAEAARIGSEFQARARTE